MIGRTHEEAEKKVDALRGRGTPDRVLSMLVAGDPASVTEQSAELLDAGLDALIFNTPDAHDLETVALIGETLAPLMAERGAAAT